MSGEIRKFGERAVNRIVVGILFLIIFGITGGVAVFLLGVPLRGDIADLGTGISNIGTAQGFGIILWWAVSTLIIAGIAILSVTKLRALMPFKNVEHQPDIPQKTFIITAVVLGAIISLLVFLANSILGIFKTNLTSVDIVKIYNALVTGDLTTLFVGLIFAMIVGTIVVAVANKTSSIQKAEEDIGLPKSARV